MKIFFFCLLICTQVWGESIFLSPVADFKSRRLTLSFLPDLDSSKLISICRVLDKDKILASFTLNLTLKPESVIKTFEHHFPLPVEIKSAKELIGTKVKCTEAVVKSSDWIVHEN